MKNIKFLTIIICIPIIILAQKKINKKNKIWATPIVAASFNNLYKVNNNVYRSEQPTQNANESLQKIGIKSILSLKQNNKDKDLFGKKEYKYYNVEMQSNDFSNHEIVEALQIIKNAPKPILVHCKHGSDRTGVVMAMYRIVFENWSKAQAIDEMKNGNYGYKIKYTNIIQYINNANIEKIKKKVFED